MALTSTQQFQAARLPIVDASVDSDDAYALAGIVFPLTSAPTLSSDLRFQLGRIPIVDAALDEKDAFAWAIAPQSGGGGNTTDVFALAWTVDPTWSFSVTDPGSGAFSISMRGFGVGFSGSITDRPAGGFSGMNAYNAKGQRKKEREERLKRLRAEIKGMNRWR